MNFQEALVTARKAGGLRQHEVAKKIGVVQSTISQWEQGNLVPVTDSYERLAKIFPGLPPPSSMKDAKTPSGNPDGNPGPRSETTRRHMSLAARRSAINRLAGEPEPPEEKGNGHVTHPVSNGAKHKQDKLAHLRTALSGLEACVWSLRAIIDRM